MDPNKLDFSRPFLKKGNGAHTRFGLVRTSVRTGSLRPLILRRESCQYSIRDLSPFPLRRDVQDPVLATGPSRVPVRDACTFTVWWAMHRRFHARARRFSLKGQQLLQCSQGCGLLPVGPSGFDFAEYRPTPRPSVEKIRKKMCFLSDRSKGSNFYGFFKSKVLTKNLTKSPPLGGIRYRESRNFRSFRSSSHHRRTLGSIIPGFIYHQILIYEEKNLRGSPHPDFACPSWELEEPKGPKGSNCAPLQLGDGMGCGKPL